VEGATCASTRDECKVQSGVAWRGQVDWYGLTRRVCAARSVREHVLSTMCFLVFDVQVRDRETCAVVDEEAVRSVILRAKPDAFISMLQEDQLNYDACALMQELPTRC
jgi:hypothetical protein